MDSPSQHTGGRAPHARFVWAAGCLLAILMTWPLAGGIGLLGRTQNSGDARFAVWNVAWVAHALTTNPSAVYDANIFHPHRRTLAYSEANLGAGVIALLPWWLTRNPLTAHNLVLLFGLATSFVAAFYLLRRLTGDTAGAAAGAGIYAFSPYIFSHTAHIQLLLAGGIPLSLIALHRVIDGPTTVRGVVLGLALAAQALSCAYYGIFAGLMVGYGTLFYAGARRLWSSRAYWIAIAAAAAVSIGLVVPFFLPYLAIQEETGFARTLDDARMYAATWRSYLASAAPAHRWMLPLIGRWGGEVLFPGYAALLLTCVGVFAAARNRSALKAGGHADRETLLFYGSFGALSFWATLGPTAGLYTLLYHTLPVFSFLRAPGRMGIVVMLCLALGAAFGVRALIALAGERRRAAAGAALCAAVIAELAQVPFPWRPADPIPRSYAVLARMPRGAVTEFPFYERRSDYHIHTFYMLYSTAHWQPLVNGYSDHTPAEFRELAVRLASFPSRDAFDAMRERRVRYITLNRRRYGRDAAAEVEGRLREFEPYLRRLAEDEDLLLFEVVAWPR